MILCLDFVNTACLFRCIADTFATFLGTCSVVGINRTLCGQTCQIDHGILGGKSTAALFVVKHLVFHVSNVHSNPVPLQYGFRSIVVHRSHVSDHKRNFVLHQLSVKRRKGRASKLRVQNQNRGHHFASIILIVQIRNHRFGSFSNHFLGQQERIALCLGYFWHFLDGLWDLRRGFHHEILEDPIGFHVVGNGSKAFQIFHVIGVFVVGHAPMQFATRRHGSQRQGNLQQTHARREVGLFLSKFQARGKFECKFSRSLKGHQVIATMTFGESIQKGMISLEKQKGLAQDRVLGRRRPGCLDRNLDFSVDNRRDKVIIIVLYGRR